MGSGLWWKRLLAQSTGLQESTNPSKPGERPATGDGGSRYVCRIFLVSRYEQRDAGEYVEQENIALSRSIPISLRWLVEPAVRQLSRDVVVGYLRETRDAVRLINPGHVASIVGKSGG